VAGTRLQVRSADTSGVICARAAHVVPILGASIIWLILSGRLDRRLSESNERTLADRTARALPIGISKPVFWLGLNGALIFWRQLGWDCVAKRHVRPPHSIPAALEHDNEWLVCCGRCLYARYYARMTRNRLLEDARRGLHPETAPREGLAERTVIFFSRGPAVHSSRRIITISGSTSTRSRAR